MEYEKTHNYIGNSNWQKKITNLIYLKCSALNYTSAVHDELYCLLFNENNFINKFIMKILFDLVFLFIGIFRAIFKGQWITSIPMVILCYLALLISTFYPPLWNRGD